MSREGFTFGIDKDELTRISEKIMQKSEEQKTVEDYLKAGNQLRKEAKLDLAIGQYKQALHLNPDFVPALSQLAGIYEGQKQFGKALPYREKAEGLQPKNALLKAQLANTMVCLGKTQEGITLYQKAIALNEHLPLWVYSGLGNALAKTRNWLPKAQLAKTMMSLGKTQEAITLYQDPKMPKRYKQKGLKSLESLYRKLLINISILAREVGDLDKAEAYLNKALDLEPDNASALSKMGNILKAKQDWKKAIIYYRKANQDNDFVNLLESLYHTDKSAFNSELIQAIENSKAIQFIKEKILSKLDIEYENHLILYLSHSNVGDTCNLLVLIKPLCIQHDRKAIVFYPEMPSPVILAKLFLDPITPKYVARHFPIDSEAIRAITTLNQKDKLHLDRIPVREGIPIMMSSMKPNNLLTYITEESIYKVGKAAAAGIKIELNDKTIGRPIINNQSVENALNKFKNLNLTQGKAILIAPHSVTFDRLTGSNSRATQFWQKIINALLDKNIIPVINSRHCDDSLAYLSELFTDQQVKFADLTLNEVIPFVELCGAFAGINSGLCRLLTFSSRKVVKLCVTPTDSGGNCFKKLPEVFDNTLMNDNFHIYYLSLDQPPEDKQINQIANLFSSEEQTTVNNSDKLRDWAPSA